MVYPCVYREHLAELLNDASAIGLSLCIQGTLANFILKGADARFIPVYTGNTDSYKKRLQTATVYPCVYREHDRTQAYDLINNGLSLCIQGTPLNNFLRCLLGRFIPVYTGNTNFIQFYSKSKTVYPCVYREHAIEDAPAMITSGLSLCIQGTL